MINEENINMIIKGNLQSFLIRDNKLELGFLELEETGKMVLHRVIVDLDNHTEDEINKMIGKTIEIDYIEPISDFYTDSNRYYTSTIFTIYQVINEDIDFEMIKA